MAGEIIDIDVVTRNLLYRIGEFRNLTRPSGVTLWYAEQLNMVAKDSREYGICLFLTKLDKLGLYQYLADSADFRIELLRIADGAGKAYEKYTFKSNNASFFDALAAERFNKAVEIARLSACTFNGDYEYEDDFTYTTFLFKLLLDNLQTNKSYARILDQLLSDMEGEELCRYSICKAIYDNDEASFFRALIEMINEHESRYDDEADRVVDHYRFRTQQYVFIEGLALRKLGKHLGFSSDQSFRYIPSELV